MIENHPGASRDFADLANVVQDTEQGVAPGTWIYTTRGPVPVEHLIAFRDCVLTGDGTYRALKDVWRDDRHAGPLVELTLKHASSPLRLNGGLRVFVIPRVPRQCISKTLL